MYELYHKIIKMSIVLIFMRDIEYIYIFQNIFIFDVYYDILLMYENGKNVVGIKMQLA